ncbi:MAG: DNA methyltransferase [Desulfobaccales bacterium]|jgi:site-specific DNA-methyltransferase (adenine-specific)
MTGEGWKNRLYFGDNVDILRDQEQFPDECVDLIYLDPPFNSNATYNILFEEKGGEKSAAQITAFDDTWHWGLESEKAYRDVITRGPDKLAALVDALRAFMGFNDMMAYIAMMAIRLVELHRVLKPSGEIYLHCDSIAHPYLRLILDAIFGPRQRRNDIIWWYQNKLPTGGRVFDRQHDIILYYVKDSRQKYTFNEIRVPTEYEGSQLITKKTAGKRIPVYDPETGKQLRVITTDKPVGDVWRINLIHPQSKERLGYPTQKPEALLERIIQASSDEGYVVLDPFCGCGTAIAVAERLHRRWLGIDITHLAITLIKNRLHTAFDNEIADYVVIGVPKDLAGAKALARQNRYQFEWWALGLVDARPAQEKKKGPDTGIDGIINFIDDPSGKAKRVVVQVKSGKVTLNQIRDLKGVLEREKAAIGAFISLAEPTALMIKEAATAGLYEPEHLPGLRYPRLQILTIAELLLGKKLVYPRIAPDVTFKKAPRQRKGPAPEDKQNNLL